MELMKIIEVLLYIFIALSVLGICISFILYKIKRIGNINHKKETEIVSLESQLHYPASINKIHDYEPKQTQNGNELYRSKTKIRDAMTLPPKTKSRFTVLNDLPKDTDMNSRSFPINYSGSNKLIERSDS